MPEAMECLQRMRRSLRILEDRLLAQAAADMGLGPSVADEIRRLATEIHEEARRIVNLTRERAGA